MSGRKYSVKHTERIFDDTTGEFFEVGPDSDGLDLICIRWGNSPKNPRGETEAMNSEQARLVGEALIRAADRMKEMEAKE